jgi:subtilisin family serine protease
MKRAGVLETLHAFTLVPGVLSVRVVPGQVEAVVAALKREAAVRYAEPDYMVAAQVQSEPYGIGYVGAPAVWPSGRGAGAKVAVLDTGVMFGHEDLPMPVLSQSFIPGQSVDDFNRHGTHCSGTVLARDNDLGVVGVAPTADLMIGKVLGNGGSGATSGVMAGVEWAVANGANVVSMSLGGGGFSQAFEDVTIAARDANVLVVAAAGNGNTIDPSYPASYADVVSVAAIDSSRNRAGFSNFGPTIDIAAPGVGVESTVPVIGSSATWDGVSRAAFALAGSGVGTVTGQAIFCGFGGVPEDFPATVAGNIAHVRRRGTDAQGNALTFLIKAQNAVAAGATAVIISNDNGGLITSGTLNATFNVPVIFISQSDGAALEAQSGVTTTAAVAITASGYSFLSGTSMATPHVAGCAGLLFGIYGNRVTADQVEAALLATAEDLGDPGRDDNFGAGLVRVDLAKALLDTQVPPACPADFDGNGVVNPDDLADFIAVFFSAPPDMRADFDASGSINPDDLADFIAAFFTPCV